LIVETNFELVNYMTLPVIIVCTFSDHVFRYCRILCKAELAVMRQSVEIALATVEAQLCLWII
jgi:hypothetical protein